MKKILILASVCFIITSCKKDYTCTCIDTPTTGNPSTSTIIIKNATSATANDLCISRDYQNGNGTVTSRETCTLK